MDIPSVVHSLSLVTIVYALLLLIPIVIVTVSTIDLEFFIFFTILIILSHGRDFDFSSIVPQILVGIRLMTYDAVPIISRFDSEKYYKDPNKNNATYPFPIMEEAGSIDLSVIVPSYNEEERREFD